MKIQICKNIKTSDLKTKTNVSGTYIFNLCKDTLYGDPQIKSSIFRKINDCMVVLPSIIDDFLLFSLSMYAADKRFSRQDAIDGWTRYFEVTIPVIELEKWIRVKDECNRLLGFLSGDVWSIDFIKTNEKLLNSPPNLLPIKLEYDTVSLFSGGLDSYCGAIRFLEEGKNPLFVGNEEYPKLSSVQLELIDILKSNYPQQKIHLETFTSQVRHPMYDDKKINKVENTTRTRSLVFIAGGLAYANCIGNDIPVYIPENGFIGLNLPLTSSRIGSCSTRTTHPFFLEKLNDLLLKLGINNRILNPFKTSAKSDMVDAVKHTKAFIDGYSRTISCSHPTLPRWRKKPYPMNCGYCYPCLIRRSSLQNHVSDETKYSYDIMNKIDKDSIMNTKKNSDYLALKSAFSTYHHNDAIPIRNIIKNTQFIENSDLELFSKCYKKTMEDLSVFFEGELDDE